MNARNKTASRVLNEGEEESCKSTVIHGEFGPIPVVDDPVDGKGESGNICPELRTTRSLTGAVGAMPGLFP